MDQSTEQIISTYTKIIWKRIQKYLKNPIYPSIFRITPTHKKENSFHWNLVNEYPHRKGKYLRPLLLLLTYEAMGGKTDKALNTAAAMQLSEEWLLIHDDLEDNSKERRGKPTLHRLFGPELAINAGDAIQIIMWKVLSDNKKYLTPVIGSKITDEFYTMLTRTVIGQTTEIKMFKSKLQQFSDDDWFFIADGKTSYYTIAGPMRLGAILAGANDKQLEAITKFGMYLGRCFQIIDDILDLTSNFRGLKKQQGNDIYEGKRTVPLGHLYRHASIVDRSHLKNIYSKSPDQKTKNDVEWVLAKMDEYKSLDYARNMGSDLKDKALDIFNKELKFLSNESSRKKLESVINFILERDH